jgi:hypothetical protein
VPSRATGNKPTVGIALHRATASPCVTEKIRKNARGAAAMCGNLVASPTARVAPERADLYDQVHVGHG